MTAASEPSAAPQRAPSVLVVLVVRDGAEWIRECLQGLAAQSFPRLGILAIDDGSLDESRSLLEHALGPQRVAHHRRAVGTSASINDLLSHPAAAAADHLLLLHGDAVLDAEAVAKMVEATQLPGVTGVGIVGAKVVDRDEPRQLRDVGRSADRFGHPYSPLQADELDQGQFDRVLEVLAVNGCSMLVVREVWQQVGLFDERLHDDHVDVDLCWRARVAGWRVLMTPLARVRHGDTGLLHEVGSASRGRRYEEDRAALASTLKNDSIVSLLWIVPLLLALSLVRVLFLAVGRRFEEAFDVAAAIGWNIAHLPGTLRLRRRVQKHRGVRDHAVRRFTRSAGLRLPRWFQTAERIIEEQRELGDEDEDVPARVRLRHRTASLVSVHPVLVAVTLGTIAGGFAVRHLVGADALAGGALPSFPSSSAGVVDELVAGFRSTGLGGALPASPALGAIGALSFMTFGSVAVAQKVLLAGSLVLASVLAYRAAIRLTGRPGPAVVGAASYVVSAVSLWAYSEGRIATLVAVAVMPSVFERLEVAFTASSPADGRWRFVAGLGVTLAVGVAFEPGLALAVGLVAVVGLAAGEARFAGLARLLQGSAVAAVLLFTAIPTFAAGGGAALASEIGPTDPWAAIALSPGAAPGDWAVAAFVPIGAFFGFALATPAHRRLAVRTGLVASIGVTLAWSSAAGYLPRPLSNAPMYTVIAAVAMSMLIAIGLASAGKGLGREAFGFRQIGAAAITVTLAVGLVLQGAATMIGGWAVGGPDNVPAAWAVVDSADDDPFRVVWIGADDGMRFPAPGGDPMGVVPAGDATVAYALTDRTGTKIVDTARSLAGPGDDALRAALTELLAGTTVHAGALLAPFGVRYVVADADRLPDAVRAALERQVDVDLVPATELVIFRNAVDLPPAGVVAADASALDVIAGDSTATIQRLRTVASTPLPRAPGGWSGPAGGGTIAVLGTEYDGAWRLDGAERAPDRAFGWSTSFPIDPAANVRVTYGDQLPRTVAAWLLAVLWAVALWVTRKPVRR